MGAHNVSVIWKERAERAEAALAKHDMAMRERREIWHVLNEITGQDAHTQALQETILEVLLDIRDSLGREKREP